MPQDSSSEQNQDDSEIEFVEIDPSGRYGRYKEVLGRGAFKKVYRGFDELEGIEIAWNQVKVEDLLRNSYDLERLYSEVHLLKTLKHKNIIKFYNSWVDSKHENINFITEIFTSGTLRQYRQKHKNINLRALKKWSRQILEGLLYLHSHDPPVIHRDVKCDNIFINGNQGEVKIGDLGLAAILRQANSAHSVIGTPEFMAPELYEEEYNELVDIYAFGMCLLELVTFEYPYVECTNAAQIYKKVTSGKRPASLAKVTDPSVKEFIEKCIANVPDRLPAIELLKDPFLQSVGETEDNVRASRPKTLHSDGTWDRIYVDKSGNDPSSGIGTDVTVHGERKDLNTIFLKLRIADSTGLFRNIHFPFDIEADTVTSVATEMVEELDLSDQDVSTIANMIDTEIRSHIPDWAPIETYEHKDELERTHSGFTENKGDESPLTNDSVSSPVSLSLERLPSGRKFWTSPKTGENSPSRHCPSNLSSRIDRVNSGDEGIISSVTSLEEKEDDGSEEEHSSEISSISNNMEADFKVIADRFESLLDKQKNELDEIKRKHELAISDFLKNLSPEMSKKFYRYMS